MNPFKRKGFDSIIGSNLNLLGDLHVQGTTVLDGTISGGTIVQATEDATLIIGGSVLLTGDLRVDNVTLTGTVLCNELIVKGTLALKKGSKLTAKRVKYQHLVMEPGAIVMAELVHMVYDTTVPEGATVLEFAK